MNNRKSGGTGIGILLTVGIMLLIGFCIDSSKPKCAMGGCNKCVLPGILTLVLKKWLIYAINGKFYSILCRVN